MKEHVQAADRPRRGVVHLAAEAEIRRVAPGLFDEFAADDEHAARSAGGIEDAHARRRLQNADHQANDIAGRVEVAALLACRLGEHVDEELVSGPEQVGELKVFVAQPVAAEMTHEVLAGIVGQDAFVALGADEADVVQHMFKRLVGFAQRAQRRVQNASIGHGGVVELVLEILPSGAFRDEESVIVIRVFAVVRLRVMQGQALFHLTREELFAFGVECIRTALQEEHPEDVVLVRRGIESFLPQPVGGRVKMTFQFCE